MNLRLSFLLAPAAALHLFAYAQNPVYLKAAAQGTGDGSSWENALTDVAAAVSLAASEGRPIYAAEGLYPVKNLSVSANLEIYGGFAGLSDDETIEGRDLSTRQTVFSGDTDGDDLYEHYTTNLYTIAKTVLEGEKIVENGKVRMPPPFESDYDGYGPNIKGSNASHAFAFAGAATLDGIFFTGYDSSNGRDNAVSFNAGGGIVRNCTFIGNRPRNGVIYSSGPATVSNCKFLFNYSYGRASGVTVHGNGRITVSDSLFLCSTKASNTTQWGAGDSANVINGWYGSFTVKGCVFARCAMATANSYNTSYGGPGNIYAAEGNGNTSFSDCVISNCFTATSAPQNLCLVSMGRATLNFERTFFLNNLSVAKPAKGRCYSLIGLSVEGSRIAAFDGCVFKGNSIRAEENAAREGDTFLLSIVGNYAPDVKTTFMNTLFDGNSVYANTENGVIPVLSRAIATAAYGNGDDNETSVANSTFVSDGKPGVYDIVQYGQGNTRNLNIVNSIFTALGDGKTSPIYADRPSLVRIYASSVQNFWPSEPFELLLLERDKVPLAPVPGVPFLAPDAKTPLIFESCLVATNRTSTTFPSTWVFKRPGENQAWEALSPGIRPKTNGRDFDASLATDALGVARTSARFTRGAVQSLSERASGGATLVLRRDPFEAGSFSYEPVQSAPIGTPFTPVSASSTDGARYAFTGWYRDGEETPYSTESTISYTPQQAETAIFTAKFSTPKVQITLDLGPHGRFLESNASTITINADALKPFPAVPEYAIDEGYVLYALDLPENTPDSHATYTAEVIPAATRIIHLVPKEEAPLVQDGKSWETAYGDLETAYRDAGKFRGEVWMKKGRYLAPENPITMLSNVALLGGFAGNETGREAANPEENQVVITGDVLDDGFWMPDMTGSDSPGMRVWQGGIYNSPNTDGAHAYWVAAGNISDNRGTAFISGEGTTTNVLFEGITFTLFKNSALYFSRGNNGAATFKNCKFLAAMADWNSNKGAATGVLHLSRTSAVIEDCLFSGSIRPIYANSDADRTVSATGCTFSDNASSGRSGVAFLENKTYVKIKNCSFLRNYSNSGGMTGGSVLGLASSSNTTVMNTIEGSVFDGNIAQGSCCSMIPMSQYAGLVVTRSSFTNNRSTGSSANNAAVCFTLHGFTPRLFVRDCYFSQNSMTPSSSSGNNHGVVLCQDAGYATFINCTIENNTANKGDSTEKAATVVLERGNSAFIGCLFNENAFSHDSLGEFRINGSYSPPAFIINSVLRNTSPGYRPFAVLSGTFPGARGSVVSNFDPDALPPLTANGYLENVVSATPDVSNLKRIGATSYGRHIRGYEYAGIGSDVYTTDNAAINDKSRVVFWDPAKNPSKPLRDSLNCNAFYATRSEARIPEEAAVIPDALGSRRKPGSIAPGPINLPNKASILCLK